MTHQHVTHVVVLVGFATAMTPYALALLQRCGLSVLQCANAEYAGRLLRTMAIDAIVLEGKYAQVPDRSPETRGLLEARARAEASTKSRIPLLVFSSPKFSKNARDFYAAAGAVVVPARDQSYRRLARLILELSGCPATCCDPRAPNQSGF